LKYYGRVDILQKTQVNVVKNKPTQLQLLEHIYQCARTLYRYNGIDPDKTNLAYDDLMDATYQYQIWLENSNND
jgi:hypothetical protein